MRAQIVTAAERWLGTPYHNKGGVLGVGVDCLMLLVRVYQEVGLVPADFDPRPLYTTQWFLHRGEERFVHGIMAWATRTANPQPGDVLLYRFGRAASHGAILVAPGQIIHAYRQTGCVERRETRSLADRFDSAWTCL